MPIESAMDAAERLNSRLSSSTSSAIKANAPTYTAPPIRPTKNATSSKVQSYQKRKIASTTKNIVKTTCTNGSIQSVLRSALRYRPELLLKKTPT